MTMTDEKDLDNSEHYCAEAVALEGLRKAGNPFPNDFRREHLASELVENYAGLAKEELEAELPAALVVSHMDCVGLWAGQLFDITGCFWPDPTLCTSG